MKKVNYQNLVTIKNRFLTILKTSIKLFLFSNKFRGNYQEYTPPLEKNHNNKPEGNPMRATRASPDFITSNPSPFPPEDFV